MESTTETKHKPRIHWWRRLAPKQRLNRFIKHSMSIRLMYQDPEEEFECQDPPEYPSNHWSDDVGMPNELEFVSYQPIPLLISNSDPSPVTDVSFTIFKGYKLLVKLEKANVDKKTIIKTFRQQFEFETRESADRSYDAAVDEKSRRLHRQHQQKELEAQIREELYFANRGIDNNDYS